MCPERWRRWRASLSWAFAVDQDAEVFSPEDLTLLDRIAATTVRRGLVTPVLLFLESLSPMNFLGSQALHALTPLLDLVGGAQDAERLAAVLGRRQAVAVLESRIEIAAAAAGASVGHAQGRG